MLKKSLLVLFTLISISVIGQQYTFTIDDCIEYAFSNSYERQQMLLNAKSQEQSLQGAKMALAPSFSASVGENYSHTGIEDATNSFSGNIGVNANWIIYAGGSLRASIQQNKAQLERQNQQNRQYDQNLTIKIIQEYVTILGQDELIKYLTQLVQTSEQQLAEGEKKRSLGAILESDYLLLQAQHATNQTNLLDSENSRLNSILALKALLSMDPTIDLNIAVPDTSLIESLKVIPAQEQVIELCMSNMPDLHLSKADMDIAKYNVKMARSGFIPTISASASIGTGHNDFDDFSRQLSNRFSQSVGINISVPIWDKGQTTTRYRQAKIAVEQAELDHKQTELNVKQSAVQAYTNVVTAMSKYDSSKTKAEAWEKTFDAYSARFEYGAITTVDLLQQQNNYISALNEYIQAKYDFILKREILNIYMGTK